MWRSANLLALFFLWRRRAILAQHFVLPRRGYAHPEWAAYTFPTAATAGAASGKRAPPGSIPPHLEARGAAPARAHVDSSFPRLFPYTQAGAVLLWQQQVDPGLQRPLSYYPMIALGFPGLLVVLLVVLLWLAALPRWLLHGLPPVPQLTPLEGEAAPTRCHLCP